MTLGKDVFSAISTIKHEKPLSGVIINGIRNVYISSIAGVPYETGIVGVI